MPEKKWDKLFLFDQAHQLPGHPYGSFDFTHMFTLNGDVVPGANMTTCTWFNEPLPYWQIYRPQVNSDDEIIGYFGSNPADLYDLGAEVEIYIGGEPYTFNKSCLLFLPQGVEYGPWRIKKMERPILVVRMHSLPNPVIWHGLSAKDPKWSEYPEFPNMEYLKRVKMEDITYVKKVGAEEHMPKMEKITSVKKAGNGKYEENFIFNLPPEMHDIESSAFSTSMFFVHNSKVFPMMNHIGAVMFHKGFPAWQKHRLRPHVHPDDEILIYLGMNPADPFDLGAEIEIYIEDEPYTFNKSCFLYMPAGVAHIPWRIKKINTNFLEILIHSSPGGGNYPGPTARDQRWSHLPWFEMNQP
jgi:hypothetical protein